MLCNHLYKKTQNYKYLGFLPSRSSNKKKNTTAFVVNYKYVFVKKINRYNKTHNTLHI